MAPPVDAETVLTTAVQIGQLLADFPRSRWDQPDAWDKAEAQLIADIQRAGGTSSRDGMSHRVRLHGMTATSTSSLPGACRNWMAQARAKHALPPEVLT